MESVLEEETATASRRSRRPPDRPAPPATAQAPAPPSRLSRILGLTIIVLLCAACVGLAFRSGAYTPADWLPFLIGIAALAIMVSVTGPAVLSGRLQRIVLAIFALQALWTVASLFWASSLGNTWEEINRTLLYVTAASLAFAAVRWAGSAGLKLLGALVVAVAGMVAVVIVVRLATAADASHFFVGGRLNYPVTYFNGLASLLMIGFWLALGLANGPAIARPEKPPEPERRRAGAAAAARNAGGVPWWMRGPGDEPIPDRAAASDTTGVPDGPPVPGAPDQAAAADAQAVEESAFRRSRKHGGAAARQRATRIPGAIPRWAQPLALAVAVLLVEVALLPQSRGALWTFFLVVPFFVIFSPNRFRALVDLGIVVAPVVLFWDRLNGVYAEFSGSGAAGPAVGIALRAIGYSVAIVVVAWAITWVIERSVAPIGRGARFWIATTLCVIVVFGAAFGVMWADLHTKGVGAYLSDRWAEFTADSADTGTTTRFSAVGLNGRLTQWKVAAKAFQENPGLGIGAQNFESYWMEHRTVAMDVRQPHSQPMQLLAELGIPGLALWIAFIVVALVAALVARFRLAGRGMQAVVAAFVIAALSWFIHSSADWLWQLAAVTLPAMLLFGGLVAVGFTVPRKARTRVATSGGAAGADEADVTAGARRRRATGAVAAEEADGVAAPAEAEAEDPFARSRMELRRASHATLLTWLTRGALAAVAAAIIVSAALPYLGIRYSELAAGGATLEAITARSKTAAAFDPTSVAPLSVKAKAYRAAGESTTITPRERIDQLKQAAETWVEATKKEPSGWLYYYQAADAYLAARGAAVAQGSFTEAEELGAQARTYLEGARRLNPLSPQVTELSKAF